jgi:hypothetical protein
MGALGAALLRGDAGDTWSLLVTATQTDGNVDAGVTQVLGVSVALRAIANDGDVFAFDQRQVSVFVVKNFHFNS